MKSILFLFLVYPLTFIQNPITQIQGKWKLEKIETTHEIIIPNKVEYYLSFQGDNVSYNLDVNRCGPKKCVIENNKISFINLGCTEICCDGRVDSISKYLNYNGSYELTDSTLTIKNDTGKFFLKKFK